jgi:adenylate kinase
MKRVIFLGPPGVGKGTVAKQLAGKLGLAHLSSGDILRAERSSGSELGKELKKYMDAGKLVPDEIVVKAMAGHISSASEKGYILDGFPRTLGQAKALDEELAKISQTPELVVDFQAPDDVIIDRLSGRLGCPNCGRIYHRTNMPPAKDNICDDCGAELTTRPDDKPEVVRERLRVYKEETAPLQEYYQKQGLLKEVDATLEAEAVADNVEKIMHS